MTKPVLQTRMVGQAPHWSGHPLAPNEYVYEVSGEVAERRKPKTTVVERVTFVVSWGWFIVAVIMILADRLG